uniref:Putative ovule protein n=1 Tax=Solanum chacoense TaxID=4108 RepID=A0A0V0GMV9_SOLCH
MAGGMVCPYYELQFSFSLVKRFSGTFCKADLEVTASFPLGSFEIFKSFNIFVSFLKLKFCKLLPAVPLFLSYKPSFPCYL